MRFFVPVAAGLIALAPLGSAAFAEGDLTPKPVAPHGAAPGETEPAAKAPKPFSLDDLFARLAAATDETEANGIAALIERRWMRSGSDTADLLMSRANEAIEAKRYDSAVELLDRVLALKPDWAEAWNRRATAFYLLEDPVDAVADLHQALARDPRHFAAWAGLGHIFMASEDKKDALDAYRRALAIHPYLEKLRPVVDRLAAELDGQKL